MMPHRSPLNAVLCIGPSATRELDRLDHVIRCAGGGACLGAITVARVASAAKAEPAEMVYYLPEPPVGWEDRRTRAWRHEQGGTVGQPAEDPAAFATPLDRTDIAQLLQLRRRDWDSFFRRAVPSDVAVVHVLASLADESSSLLAEVCRELASRSSDSVVHVHAVLPALCETLRGSSHAVEAATATLLELSQLSTRSAVKFAWWFLGDNATATRRILAEACTIVCRLTTDSPPDPVSCWLAKLFEDPHSIAGTSLREQGSMIGTYRYFTGSEVERPHQRPWLHGFAESFVPVHRSDLLDRLFVGWQEATGEPRPLPALDANWQLAAPQFSAVPGTARGWFWCGLEHDDLWFWNPVMRRQKMRAN